MRPRCCFRNFTFFGINMMGYLQALVRAQRVQLALVDPALHADLAEARLGLRRAVVDVRAQGVQRQLAVQVPLGARDLRAIQPAGHPDLDALDRKSTRLNSSHSQISYAVFCLKKKKKSRKNQRSEG